MLERSKTYDRAMARKCMAGPNALYLTEELTESMHLKEKMLVLDLGCGRGLSSMFLAKEYGVQVYAVDKNEYASETYNMLKDVGLAEKVYPIQADAASLPIPAGVVDALVCVNSYHNFGMTAGFFEEKIRPLLRADAELGFVLLGRDASFGGGNENPIFWTADEWRLWFESEGINVKVCDQLHCTRQAWTEWMSISSPALTEKELDKTNFNPELALIKIVGTL